MKRRLLTSLIAVLAALFILACLPLCFSRVWQKHVSAIVGSRVAEIHATRMAWKLIWATDQSGTIANEIALKNGNFSTRGEIDFYAIDYPAVNLGRGAVGPISWQRWKAGPLSMTEITAATGLPIWLFGLLLLTTAVLRFRYRLRNVAGLCKQCGYDVRASPHRCPECGTPVTTTT